MNIKKLVNSCIMCKDPNKPLLTPTATPNYPGHSNHIDLFSTETHCVLVAINKFTKFDQAKIIPSKSVEDIRQLLRNILLFFCVPKNVVIDNEGALRSVSLTAMMEDDLKIKIFRAVPYKSEVEIMQCLKKEGL